MRAHKPLLLRVTLMSVAVTGLFIAWSQNQAPVELKIEEVTANLWMISESGGNVAVMPTDEGVILVDDKFPQDNPQILAKVKSVSDKPIRYVLNTHQHGDHTGGNQALMTGNTEFVIHKNARANMAAGKMPGIPRITFSDESQVFLGGKEVMAKYLGRGHTNGDSVILFPSERVLHTGDLFTNGAPFCDASAKCSIKEWDATLQKAMQLDFDTVIPGHGPVMKKADLQKYIEMIPVFREQVKKACTGVPPAEAAARLDLSVLKMPNTGFFARGVPGMCQELTN